MREPYRIPGFGLISAEGRGDLADRGESADGFWRLGRRGVERILVPRDPRVEYIVFSDQTLAQINAGLGPTALYPLEEACFEPPARAVLMDLDGTSVRSEAFWVGIIERTTAQLRGEPGFHLVAEDEPFVAGHSVSEHLLYCIRKYCPETPLEDARTVYFELARRELNEIVAGGGRADAFVPSPGLREFLLELKGRGVRIGLVTSGLHEKAWPEILAAFRSLQLGDPLEFYDTIITAGQMPSPGVSGTLGELAPKPHPWLYAEAAYVGLGMTPGDRRHVIGLEDSGAGVVAIRLAGFAAIGLTGGNYASAGARPLLHAESSSLLDVLPILLGV